MWGTFEWAYGRGVVFAIVIFKKCARLSDSSGLGVPFQLFLVSRFDLFVQTE